MKILITGGTGLVGTAINKIKDNYAEDGIKKSVK